VQQRNLKRKKSACWRLGRAQKRTEIAMNVFKQGALGVQLLSNLEKWAKSTHSQARAFDVHGREQLKESALKKSSWRGGDASF
jgi:hypothetical protein